MTALAALAVACPLGAPAALVGVAASASIVALSHLAWLMMDAGYAPALRATLDARIAAATADGNPALDFVGSGGAACLAA